MKMFNDLAKKVSEYHEEDKKQATPGTPEPASCPHCGKELPSETEGNPELYNKMDPDRAKKIMKGGGFI